MTSKKPPKELIKMIRMVGLEIKIKSFPIETKQTIGKVFLLRRSVSNKMETGY